MTHPNTQAFIDDWRARCGERRMPSRADLNPAVFGRLAPQLFMLGMEADGSDVFRLAGGFLNELHGRELAGGRFAALWPQDQRPEVNRTIARARRDATPRVLSAWAEPVYGEPIGIEVTLAPVVGPTGLPDRIFGLYQPTTLVARLRGRMVQTLSLRAVSSDSEDSRSRLRLVSLDGRRVA